MAAACTAIHRDLRALPSDSPRQVGQQVARSAHLDAPPSHRGGAFGRRSGSRSRGSVMKLRNAFPDFRRQTNPHSGRRLAYPRTRDSLSTTMVPGPPAIMLSDQGMPRSSDHFGGSLSKYSSRRWCGDVRAHVPQDDGLRVGVQVA